MPAPLRPCVPVSPVASKKQIAPGKFGPASWERPESFHTLASQEITGLVTPGDSPVEMPPSPFHRCKTWIWEVTPQPSETPLCSCRGSQPLEHNPHLVFLCLFGFLMCFLAGLNIRKTKGAKITPCLSVPWNSSLELQSPNHRKWNCGHL